MAYWPPIVRIVWYDEYEQTFGNVRAAVVRAVVKEWKKLNYDYIKAILYAYPTMDEIGEAVGASADNKALLSYKDPRGAEDVAVDILKEIAARRALKELSCLVEGLLKDCSAEELFLLEYKYFRRKQFMKEAVPVSCTRRTYFRKQDRLLKKAADYIYRGGWTQERFLEETNGLFSRVVEAIAHGSERSVRSDGQTRHSSS